MSIVTVYPYEEYDPERDGFMPTKVAVFATMETITNNSKLRVIASKGLQVDSSQINETGHYHQPLSKPSA